MQLTDEDIKEYQQIWKEVFGEEISASDATYSGNRLLELFVILGKNGALSSPRVAPKD